MVDLMAAILGVETPRMSTGSTEPKTILVLANDELGLGLSNTLSKPRLAEQICSAAGIDWDQSCWSSGSTVTAAGLRRVGRAMCSLASRNDLADQFR